MTEYFQKNLFKDISIDEYKKLLSCLDGRTKQFKAGETICDYDEGFHEIGIIGKGTASVVRYEYNGARTILERLAPRTSSAICCPTRAANMPVSALSATAPVTFSSSTMPPSALPAPSPAPTTTS